MPEKNEVTLELTNTFRAFLRNLARSMIATKYKGMSVTEAKKELLKRVDISASALEGMLYRGNGGMDSWVALLGHLSDLNPKQLDLALTEFQDLLRKKRKITPGESAWIKRGDTLSEDKKLFWTDLIGVMEDLDGGPYVIQKRK